MIDNFYMILPGQKLNAVDLAGESRCFDAILCDGVVTTLSAKSVLQNTNAGNITALIDGSYIATDAGSRIVNTPVIQGQFSEVYCASTSDPIRVHLVRY